jgi:hypothetical protein
MNQARNIVLFLILSFFISNKLIADEKPDSTNLQIIDTELTRNLTEVSTFIKSHVEDTLYIRTFQSEEDLYYQLKLMSFLPSEKIKVFTIAVGDFKTPRLECMAEIKTEYINAESNRDLVIRTISVKTSGILSSKNGSIVSIPGMQTQKTDLVPREKIDYYNGSRPFSKSIPPEQPTSLWQDIVQPLVIVGTAVITVGLLFTVRSK